MLFGNVPSIFPTKKGVEKVDDITFYSSGFLKGRIQYRFPQKSDYYIELSVNPVFLIKSFFAVLALLLVASLIFMATMSYLAVVERDKRLRIFDAAVDDLINNDIPSHYLSTAMPNIEKSWRVMKSKINSLQSEIVLQSKTLAKSEAISQTTQTIAHDLKGPLAIFQKVAFGTLEDYEHEKENLVKALNRLSSMADSIKRADLESQVRPYKSRLDLDETISSARSYAEKHSVILRSDAKSVEDLQIDLPKVERAVSNLLFNAIEAANSIVEISWLLEGAKLSILVKDDGDGVPNKLIPKLFTRGATHGKENGTGLGLAFVDHVAKGHGGKVGKSSNLCVLKPFFPFLTITTYS
ncbi:sensor histidine kinase [Pseudobacteriovorax antillogorgiicola]|nr:HAMP domain-containing sensor histidine kinase [Pseudobacteriovorax antillogorgiicola]